MSQHDSGRDESDRLEHQVEQLVNERSALFDKARNGLSAADQQRLGAVERELDECFVERRRLRAVRDADRFDNRRFIRRRTLPRPGSQPT